MSAEKLSVGAMSLALNMSNSTECSYQSMEYLVFKLVFVALFGFIVAFCGLVGNGLLFFLFFRSGRQLTSNGKIFCSIALVDFGFCFSYILMFPVEVLFDWFKWFWLYRLWIHYCQAVYALGHMCQSAGNYLVICLALERYLTLRYAWIHRLICNRHGSIIGIVTILFFNTLYKGVTAFEIGVEYRPDCDGFESMSVIRSEFGRNELYNTVTMYLKSILQIFLPFFTLLFLNLSITWHYYRSTKRSRVLKLCRLENLAAERRSAISLSTKCLLVIVVNHLIGSFMTLALDVFERVNYPYLEKHRFFYTMSRDAISFSSVFNALLRFAVQMISNAALRERIFELVHHHTRAVRKLSQIAVTTTYCDDPSAQIMTPQKQSLPDSVFLELAMLPASDGYSRRSSRILINHEAMGVLGADQPNRSNSSTGPLLTVDSACNLRRRSLSVSRLPTSPEEAGSHLSTPTDLRKHSSNADLFRIDDTLSTSIGSVDQNDNKSVIWL